jgi:ribosomal protein S18 acetylase RimI-like enzyme
LSEAKSTAGQTIAISIRDATPADRSRLAEAIVELQDYERRLHDSRRPGVEIAAPYLASIEARAARQGAILVAEANGVFVGFVAGWIDRDDDSICEADEFNRFGFVSDICVVNAFRGRAIASRLLDAIEARLAEFGAERLRINVLAANLSARASYERSGFSPYEMQYEKRLR